MLPGPAHEPDTELGAVPGGLEPADQRGAVRPEHVVPKPQGGAVLRDAGLTPCPEQLDPARVPTPVRAMVHAPGRRPFFCDLDGVLAESSTIDVELPTGSGGVKAAGELRPLAKGWVRGWTTTQAGLVTAASFRT